ncbi:MAG: putative ABC transporter permease [Oscillospiraceae bacterium]|nr:putative ABC transporter permease [Oscillospiraceae bacterium]
MSRSKTKGLIFHGGRNFSAEDERMVTDMDNRIYYFILMAALISFLGFVLENMWLAVTKGFIDNRNMTLPFLMGYGMFITCFYLIIGTPESFVLFASPRLHSRAMRYITYFAVTFLVVSVGEIIIGKFTEGFFGFYYWNYERLPMHITRYTSVPTSTGFSVIITFFMGKCFMPILYALEKLPLEFVKPVSAIAAMALTSDFIVSFRKMHINRAPNLRWIRYIRGGKRLSGIKAK